MTLLESAAAQRGKPESAGEVLARLSRKHRETALLAPSRPSRIVGPIWKPVRARPGRSPLKGAAEAR
jgi:hypothetical protein